jgi:hypothetical protein
MIRRIKWQVNRNGGTFFLKMKSQMMKDGGKCGIEIWILCTATRIWRMVGHTPPEVHQTEHLRRGFIGESAGQL